MTNEGQGRVSQGQFSSLNYGEQVHLHRRRAKITQRALGGSVGMSESELSRVESGERLLTHDKADSVAEVLSGRLLDNGIKGRLDAGYQRETLLRETSQKLATIFRESISTEGLELLNSMANTQEGVSAILGLLSQLLDSETKTEKKSNF